MLCNPPAFGALVVVIILCVLPWGSVPVLRAGPSSFSSYLWFPISLSSPLAPLTRFRPKPFVWGHDRPVVLSETLSQALSETLKSEKTREKLEDRNVKARPCTRP